MDSLQIVVLLMLYLTCAITFFLYMFLVVSPERITKRVHDLFTDEQFVRETTSLTRQLTVEEVNATLIPAINERFVAVLKNFDFGVPAPISVADVKDAMLPAINDKFVAVLEEFDFGIGEDFFTSIGQHVTNHLNTWYARKAGEVKKQEVNETREVRDGVALASLNQGNPAAVQMIFQKIAEKNPLVGGFLQLASMGRRNGSQRPPSQGGSGGY